jgi:hypothetical protein
MAKALKKHLYKKAKTQQANMAKPHFTNRSNSQLCKVANIHLS